LALKSLEDILDQSHLLKIAICIEATIPFRRLNENNESWCDILYKRVKEIVTNRDVLHMSDDVIVSSIQNAVILANRDVGGFSSALTQEFLKNTWNLLPESNACLRTPGVFTLKVLEILFFESSVA
jgi:hypothetical protein